MNNVLNKLNSSALKFNIEMANTVENICKPLFDNFVITNFGYSRHFKDGTMLRLSADKEWSKKYFEHQFYNDIIFYNFPDIAENNSELRIITNEPTCAHYSALYDHNLWNIYTIARRHQDFAEIFFFATAKEKTEAINFYINNKNMLENYIEYFKNSAASWMIANDPNILISTELKLTYHQLKESKKIDKFFKLICSDFDQEKLSFTVREEECIKQLILGKTAKETASALNISYRTVESHFNNIKRKAGCKKISQFLALFLEKKL